MALRDFKTSTILVYMSLNGKGDLTGCGLFIFVCLFLYNIVEQWRRSGGELHQVCADWRSVS